MANRFSTGQDYSATFSNLYAQQAASNRAAAQRIDAKRETELAARDALIFTKWQEGKISGGQLMAHIRSRLNATGYDKAQQLKWREAAIKYGDVIADEKAEARYAQNENISELIAHYAGRMSTTKKGTPERRELAQRLKSLRDERTTTSVRKQSAKIARAIQAGKMNTQDLINYYKSVLPGLKGELRETVLGSLADARAKRRNENFEAGMQKIDNELATGHISPQMAANQKEAILVKFGIENQDKANYQKWLQQIQQLRATPDPADVAQLDFDLAAENITPEEYYAQIKQWADQIAPFDLEASWALRNEAQKFLDSEATPLKDPSILGQTGEIGTASDDIGGGSRGYTGPVDVVRRLRGNAIKFITQFDGSRYSGTNCAMASGAMLAHAMGYTGFTGADLRSASGDTQGGTNVGNVAAALERVGVEGARLSYQNQIAYEKFNQRLVNGAPAVLSGWTGDIPAQFNTTSGIMGHSIMVAGYDAKRKAYLVLDPSDKRQTGVWWPETVLEDFGWGGGINGLAVFAPRGTIDPKTLMRTGGKVKHISVNAKPTKPGSQPMTQFDPGPAANRALETAASKELLVQRERLRDGGVSEEELAKLTTEQRVENLIDDRSDQIAELQDVVDRVMEQVEADGGVFEGEIEMAGTGEVLTDGDISAIQKNLIYLYDAQEVLYLSVDAKDKARDETNKRRAILVGATILNSLETVYTTNVAIKDVEKGIRKLAEAKTPDEYSAIVDDVKEALGVVVTINEDEEADGDERHEVVTTEADAAAEKVDTGSVKSIESPLSEWVRVGTLLDSAIDDPEKMIEAMVELMPELEMTQSDEGHKLLSDLVTIYADEANLVAEEGEEPATGWVMIPDEDGEHHLVPVQMIQSERWNMATQEMEPISYPDMASLGEEITDLMTTLKMTAQTLPVARVGGVDGVQRVAVLPDYRPYKGVEMLKWGENVDGPTISKLDDLEIKTGGGKPWAPKTPVSEDHLDILEANPGLMEDMIARGMLVPQDWPTEQIRFGGEVWYGDKQVTEIGTQTLYHRDAIPYVARQNPDPSIVRFGTPYFGGTTVGGNLWVEYTQEDFDESQAGSPFIDIDITNEQARQDTIDNGPPNGVEKPVYARDPNSPSDSFVITEADPRHYMNPHPATQAEYQRDQQLIHDQVADKMIQQLSPEEAAEVAFLDPTEFNEMAARLGVDPYSGEYTEFGPTETPEQSILKDELQVVSSTQEEPSERAPQLFDHAAALRGEAMGVAKANKADRAAKVAKAQEDAAAATAQMSIPRIKPAKPATPVTETGAKSFQAPNPYTAPDGPTTPRPDPAPVTRPSPTPTPPTTQPTAPRSTPRSGQTRHL